MYCIFISKHRNNKEKNIATEYIKILEDYVNSVNYKPILFISPGYKNKSLKTANTFVSEIKKTLTNSCELMFFRGMNGLKTLTNTGNAFKNNGIAAHSLFDILDTDHRKVIWICEKDFHSYEFDNIPLNEYIDSLKVHAIFVDSSNFLLILFLMHLKVKWIFFYLIVIHINLRVMI